MGRHLVLGWKPKAPDPSVASVRYRCLIPLRELQARKFPVALYEEPYRDHYTGVIFSKLYDTEHQVLARRLKARGAMVILDLCDNHFYNPSDLPEYRRARADLLRMIELADLLICSTPTLAEIVQEEAHLRKRPEVVGDPVEPLSPGRIYSPARGEGMGLPLPRLLWFGVHGAPNAPCGMLDLLNVADVLIGVGREHPFELVVVSNNRAKFRKHIAPLPIRSSYLEWDANTFPGIVARATAVVIPVTRNPFTLCKSNNRLATALAVRTPVIADAIPSYREFTDFCYLDDWERGLSAVLGGDRRAIEKALAGQAHVARYWSPAAVADRWEAVLMPFVFGAGKTASLRPPGAGERHERC